MPLGHEEEAGTDAVRLNVGRPVTEGRRIRVVVTVFGTPLAPSALFGRTGGCEGVCDFSIALAFDNNFGFEAGIRMVDPVALTSTDLDFSRRLAAENLDGEDGFAGEAGRDLGMFEIVTGFSSESELFQLLALFKLDLVSLSSTSVCV